MAGNGDGTSLIKNSANELEFLQLNKWVSKLLTEYSIIGENLPQQILENYIVYYFSCRALYLVVKMISTKEKLHFLISK